MTERVLRGIHHVTAITDNAMRNYKFITEVLGMRLVKKTVNQDDIQTYHTFFADDIGSPGTDLTFFDFNGIPAGRSGTNEISRIGLRVPTDEALTYYKKRFEEFGVKHKEIEELYGALTLEFEEEDGQAYRLYSDQHNEGIPAGTPWQKGPVPTEYAIYGLGPVEMTLSYSEDFIRIMQDIFGFRIKAADEEKTLLEVGDGGHGGQVIIIKDETSPVSIQGSGEVHHVAFRVKDHDELKAWEAYYKELQIPSSGWVDRFYFEALYTRIGHILLELSTDGPGFMQDEPYETMGESLSLPPFLEGQRAEIEAAVRPFDTSRPKD